MLYISFFVYCNAFASCAVGLTADEAQGNDSKLKRDYWMLSFSFIEVQRTFLRWCDKSLKTSGTILECVGLSYGPIICHCDWDPLDLLRSCDLSLQPSGAILECVGLSYGLMVCHRDSDPLANAVDFRMDVHYMTAIIKQNSLWDMFAGRPFTASQLTRK